MERMGGTWPTGEGKLAGDLARSLDLLSNSNAIYSTTPTSRRIWSIENKRFQWMKRILHLEPEETAS